jgi:Ca-activated chloride channel family protein
MTFLWPHLLWLALAVPLLAAVGQTFPLRRKGAATPDPAPNIKRGAAAGGRVRFGPKVRTGGGVPWRFWAAMLLAVLALARPQWGRVDALPGEQAPGEVIIALDLSRSMLAPDVGPSRMERARLIATNLVEELPDRRIGLIGFAGAAYLLAPASEDRAILQAFLPIVGPEHLITQGSNFSAMLDTALASFSNTRQGRSLVVLTDGEAEPGAWQDRIDALSARNVRVIAVGMGTPAGATPRSPSGELLLDPAGAPIVSRLVPGTLSAMVGQTGGQVSNFAQAADLPALVRAASAMPPEQVGDLDESRIRQSDQYFWFVLAALLMLAWSAAREFSARPILHRRVEADQAGLSLMALAIAMATVMSAQHAEAQRRPLLTVDDLQGETEPLERMKVVVGEMLAKRRLDAADYLKVVEVSTRYGEIHRGHGHPIEEGVLEDGLAAVAVGRALDPDLADWAAAKAKLDRLLVPPPSIPMEDPGPADPANEPMDGQGEAPQPGEDGKEGGEDGAPEDENEPTAGEQGLQAVGGTQKDVFNEAEWRNPALVQPLDQLERLRAADSPAELFRFMQTPPPRGTRRAVQTW